ncbi:hypothetical protein [Crossiella cryophila]|uniref:Uncharacterized protein n=1 Tax=Crossiella cryophila TaxID=43355 RepID=A0A7W7CJI6_9PSEU|nr:hypothetical protein [Crossiella cryophila]MBB4680926.1 hypothetical protein [Crossiella cryophila]
MSDIDFYADLVATGAVLGADRHWTPAELDELFDADNREYVEAVSTEALNLDYGLLEYFWERESRRGAPWHGVHLSAQVHRLAIGFGDTPALLRENYGEFEPNPSFAELRAELQRRDIPLLDLPQEMPAHRSYWQPDSQAVVIEIVGQEEFVTSPTEEIGSISGISAPGLLHNLPRARFDALKQSLNHLATAGDADRLRWLDRHDPAPGQERAEWWRSRLTVFAIKLGWRESAEAVWVPLYLWFADQAVRRGALDPAEVARRVAESAARLELYGHNGSEDRPALLPVAEDLTTTLLAGVPLDRVDAEQRWGVPGLHGTEVRPLLRARQLVETAARLRPFLRDSAVIAELGEWLRVWPEFGRSAGLLEMRSD